ncbi:MAG TPA: hypothetical protein VH417_04435 [Vicinamibacterales bacterium]
MSRSAALVCVLLAASAGACGKKGPPLPPLVRLPVAPGDFTAARRGASADVRFVVPGTNTDGSKPADIIRVDVYAMSSVDPVTDDEVMRRGHRIGMLEIKPPPDPDEDPDAPRPETDAEKEKGLLDQGAPAQVTESIPEADSAGIRYYVSVGINKRGRRGPLTRRSAVPLGPAPAAPPAPTIAYDEKAVTVSWPEAAPEAAAAGVEVYDATTGKRLTDKPVTAATFTDQRIEWGVERCYVIGRLAELEHLPVESESSEKACVTLKDTFPPAAPTGVTAVAAEGSVNLIWNANSEADLAGYLVLRGTGGEKPKAITPKPIQETTFRDEVPSGTRATYAIQAVDKAGNASAVSETTEETAR